MNTFNLGKISPALANEIKEAKPYKEYQKPNGEKIVIETKEDFDKIVDLFHYMKNKAARVDTLEPENSLIQNECALKKVVG